MKDLIERLRKRAEEDTSIAKNSEVVADALLGQMELFSAGEGGHNIYAVRLHLDHRNSAKRDRKYAGDLLEAVAILEGLA